MSPGEHGSGRRHSRTVHLSLFASLLLLTIGQCAGLVPTRDSEKISSPSTSFAKAPVVEYPLIFSAPVRIAQTARNLKDAVTQSDANLRDEFTKLLRGAERFQTLAARGVMSNWEIPDVDGEMFGLEGPVLLQTALTSLRSLSDSGVTSDRCVNDTGHLLVSMLERQGWALKYLDAMGKIGPGLTEFKVNFVGDYDLCRSLVAPPSNDTDGFTGNYVTLKASLGPPNPANPLASLIVQWGVCMPSTCTDTENTLFLSEAVQRLGLNKTLYVMQAENHTVQTEVTTATVVAIIIIVVVGVLMIMGTTFDLLFIQWPAWKAQWAEEQQKLVNLEPGHGDVTVVTAGGLGEDEPLLGKKAETSSVAAPVGKLAQVLLAFSVYTNGSKVLNTSQAPGSISCLHGIRFLSMSWVILGHTFAFGIADIDNVATEVPILLKRWTFDAVANAFVSVDTFFTIGGILVAYLTVQEMKRSSWKINWGLFYFHRYWRLTPPYMLVMVLFLGLQQYCGQGPLWSSVQPADREPCEQNWWTNLLYINNLVHSEKVCLGQSWYLANDMQFFFVSPLMLIPFYFHAGLGFASCGVFLLTHCITTGVLSTKNEWPATLVSPKAASMMSSYFTDYYIVPWCRIGPYIVGIMTGYILANRRRLRITWPVALIGWLVAGATALAALYGLRGDIGGEHLNSVQVAAFYNAMARTAWGASICWVVVACVSGWGGFINTFLSWSPFVVLGRLTYMAYLVHLNLLSIFFQNQQTLYHLTSINIAMTFMGIMVATYVLSFFFMLGLESPMIGLEKVFLPKRRKD